MARGNLVLMILLVICALSVITAQHRARSLFQALEAEQQRARALEDEYGQLQLERSTWAVHTRIESVAASRLKMHAPDPAATIRAGQMGEGR